MFSLHLDLQLYNHRVKFGFTPYIRVSNISGRFFEERDLTSLPIYLVTVFLVPLADVVDVPTWNQLTAAEYRVTGSIPR